MKKILILITAVLVMSFAGVQAQAHWAQMLPPTSNDILTIEYINFEQHVFGQDFGYRWTTTANWQPAEVFGQARISCYHAGYLMIAGDGMIPAVSSESYDFNFWASVPGLSWADPIADLVPYLNSIVILPEYGSLAGIFSDQGIDTLHMLTDYYAQQGFSVDEQLFVVYADNSNLLLSVTDDYGQNWLPIDFDFQGIAVSTAISPQGKIALAVNNGDDSYVLVSEDNGYNWHTNAEFQDQQLVSVDFLNNEVVVAGNQNTSGFFYDGAYEWFNENVTKLIATDNTLFEIIISGNKGSVFMRANNPLGLNNGTADEEIVDNITIYPNPCTDKLHISFDTDSKLTTVNVYSMNGQLVRRIETENNTVIDVSDLPNGLYSVQINGKTTKMVKM